MLAVFTGVLMAASAAAAPRCHTIAGIAPPLGIMLPEGVETKSTAGMFIISFGANTRYNNQIRLLPPPAALGGGERARWLNEQFRIAYSTDTAEVGSGGPEGYLTGTILRADAKTPAALVSCGMQSEWGADPEWCLEHVRTLKEGGCD